MTNKGQTFLCRCEKAAGETAHSCPSIQWCDGVVIILDDFGGDVEFAPTAWNVLLRKIRDGELRELP